jgi:hypothetical protein
MLSLTEFVRDGELERTLSGGGLVWPSASADDLRDIPGNLVLPMAVPSSMSSSWLRRYAAEPMPLSGVCLNQVGSFVPSDSAICARDSSLLFSDAGSGVLFTGSDVPLARSGELFVGSGVPLGDLAAFSCASHESGLLPSLDFGRCCQESVPDRANCVAVRGVDVVGEVVVSSVILFASSLLALGEAGVLSLDLAVAAL